MYTNKLNLTNMKNLFLLSFFFLLFSCGAKKMQAKKTIIISQKETKTSDTYLKLKNVLNDSRCPQGTNCIWAGEVTTILQVYKNNEAVEEKSITFNSKNRDENYKWLENFYSKKIKSVSVLPYPKDGIEIKKEDYFIEIFF